VKEQGLETRKLRQLLEKEKEERYVAKFSISKVILKSCVKKLS